MELLIQTNRDESSSSAIQTHTRISRSSGSIAHDRCGAAEKSTTIFTSSASQLGRTNIWFYRNNAAIAALISALQILCNISTHWQILVRCRHYRYDVSTPLYLLQSCFRAQFRTSYPSKHGRDTLGKIIVWNMINVNVTRYLHWYGQWRPCLHCDRGDGCGSSHHKTPSLTTLSIHYLQSILLTLLMSPL